MMALCISETVWEVAGIMNRQEKRRVRKHWPSSGSFMSSSGPPHGSTPWQPEHVGLNSSMRRVCAQNLEVITPAGLCQRESATISRAVRRYQSVADLELPTCENPVGDFALRQCPQIIAACEHVNVTSMPCGRHIEKDSVMFTCHLPPGRAQAH